MKEKIIGHIPLYLSKAILKFLQFSLSKLGCTVIGKRVSRAVGFGLEIPIKYTLYGYEKASSWIQGKKIINNMKKKC